VRRALPCARRANFGWNPRQYFGIRRAQTGARRVNFAARSTTFRYTRMSQRTQNQGVVSARHSGNPLPSPPQWFTPSPLRGHKTMVLCPQDEVVYPPPTHPPTHHHHHHPPPTPPSGYKTMVLFASAKTRLTFVAHNMIFIVTDVLFRNIIQTCFSSSGLYLNRYIAGACLFTDKIDRLFVLIALDIFRQRS
jgi:hypothetical protein